MRRLFLLRHAKSAWDDPALSDFERPLAPCGKKAALLMGREMTRRGWLPDLAVVSSAVRTRETWELAGAQLAAPCRTHFTEAIYEAAPWRILAEINNVPDDVGSLLVVGHNPGLELLARMLAGPGSAASALDRLNAKFPTAAIASLDVESDWAELGAASARLTDFITPRELG